MSKKAIAILFGILILGSGILSQEKSAAPPKQDAKVEKPAVKDPPPAWIELVQEYDAENIAIDKAQKEAGIDKLINLREKLRVQILKEIPEGYHYESKTGKWELNPPPTPPEKK